MKKEYTSPRIKLRKMEMETLLAASGVSGGDIGYGGVDTEGDKEPNAKESLWEE